MTNIPVVDISSSHDPVARLKIAADLAKACKDVGFVYIVGHGIPAETLQRVFALSKDFFALPLEEKKKALHSPIRGQLRGFASAGMERVVDLEQSVVEGRTIEQITECKESFDVGHDDNETQTNIWPPEEIAPGFRTQTTDFYNRCQDVSQELIRLITLGIGLKDEETLARHHSGKYNQLRYLFYPPIGTAEVEAGSATRMPAHTDWGTITLLFQDTCGGLEIEDPHNHGSFLAAPAIENALIMNIADILMRWSNDSLLSSKHRVGIPSNLAQAGPEGRVAPARYSIPYFVAPDPETNVECQEVYTSADKPAKYSPIKWQDYLVMRASAIWGQGEAY